MPQGKMKIKTKKPMYQVRKASKPKKSGTYQRRNKPALPKPLENTLRSEITKSINAANENTAKERANLDGKTFHVIPPPVSIQGSSASKKSSSNKTENSSNKKSKK